jgi:GT2 family glycosyltransferase
VNNPVVALHRARPTTVVAIPVRDEAERITACLTALDRQDRLPDMVLLLLNNCTDTTEAIARVLARSFRFDLKLICRELPPAQANAGSARRIALALAARVAGPDGILLTTDADAVVSPDWVSRNVAGLRRGSDLICGRIVVDPVEAAMIPAHLHKDDRLECSLIGLLDDMAWIIDPDPNDPPLRHTEASGASLAVSVAAFDRVGGIPRVPSGEDRAFVDALQRMDARIRHDPAINVTVSARIVGRAQGGMADAIRRRMVRQDVFTDDQVEPAHDSLRRLTLRRRARSAWSSGVVDRALAAGLGLDSARLAEALSAAYFGAAWAEIESRSPTLRRQRVRFVDLPKEIAAANRLLAWLTSDAVAAD